MAVESTKFDTWLKEKLYRDLIFRGLIWLFLPLLGSYYAIYVDAVDPLEFMLKTTGSIMRGLDIVGVFAILLSCAALMFKDLELCDSKNWGQETRKGYFGGGIRRLAGDLTLWSLGATLTILSVTLIAVVLSNAPIKFLMVLMVFFLNVLWWVVVISVLNILVRRAQSLPLLGKLKTPRKIILVYSAGLLFCSVAVLAG